VGGALCLAAGLAALLRALLAGPPPACLASGLYLLAGARLAAGGWDTASWLLLHISQIALQPCRSLGRP
jgi:hypothetical protein